ncbi:MAG TPA: pyridoxal phosphate-dependent aminotransferase [Gemmatimonadaceae bacterium]|nr:pyridoxal phosphate-dependent aminotransferase [Gemmatimonadaceae bacterium]
MTSPIAVQLAIASRIDGLRSEGAFEVLASARALERKGRHILHLEIGEPDFPTAPHIVEAGVRALQNGETKYGPAGGILELRVAIANHLASHGISAAPDDIVVTPGSKPILLYAALALLENGDEALVPDPAYPIYDSVVRFAGGRPVTYRLESANRFAPDVDAIAASITPRTRVLVLNTPQNPTGGVIDAGRLAALAELAEANDLIVIVDEIYRPFNYGAAPVPSILTIPGMRERCILVDGFSKAHAMTGWRLGYGLLPTPLASRFALLALNDHACVPAFVQRAGIAALTGTQEPLHAMINEFAARRALVTERLAAIPGVSIDAPAGAFYAFPNVSEATRAAGITSAQLASKLLHDFGVALLPGTAFGAGGEGHLRLSFATGRADLERALTLVHECFQSLAS